MEEADMFLCSATQRRHLVKVQNGVKDLMLQNSSRTQSHCNPTKYAITSRSSWTKWYHMLPVKAAFYDPYLCSSSGGDLECLK